MIFIFVFIIYMFYPLLVSLIAFLLSFLLNKQRSVIHVLFCIVSKNGLNCVVLFSWCTHFTFKEWLHVSLYWWKKSFAQVPSLYYSKLSYIIYIYLIRKPLNSYITLITFIHHIVYLKNRFKSHFHVHHVGIEARWIIH